MSTAEYTAARLKEMKSETDWQRVDAMSDESIAEAVETDPDARLLDAADFKKMRRCRRDKVFLLSIAGLGAAEEDLSERDEEILSEEIDPVRGWSLNRIKIFNE